jgi:acyl dehydratase
VAKEELSGYVGQEFGPTEWIELSQDKIDRFADLTQDRQFIHVDVQNAKNTPFGGTIAHGYFTMSLAAFFQSQAGVYPKNMLMGVNYGMNRLRFLQPVRAGKRVRGRIKPVSFTEKSPGQLLAATEVTVEIEGESKPALVAETLTLYQLAG